MVRRSCYWTFGDYLALGAGAHGKISRPDNGTILRYRKTRLPTHYLAGDGQRRLDSQDIPPNERPLEFLLNALRLVEGVDEGLFTERTGLPLTSLEPPLSTLRQQGLLVPDRLACTDTGLRFLNRVLGAFQS